MHQQLLLFSTHLLLLLLREHRHDVKAPVLAAAAVETFTETLPMLLQLVLRWQRLLLCLLLPLLRLHIVGGR